MVYKLLIYQLWVGSCYKWVARENFCPLCRREPKLLMQMADMLGHAVKMAPKADDTYRIAVDVAAPSEWVLEPMAQIPGKKESVQSSLKPQVVK